MEANHLNNLVKQVKFAGFGENFEMEIRNRIANNEPSFEFRYKPDFKNSCEATGFIRKSDTKDDYYFNSYNIVVQKGGMEPLQQKVYVERPQQDKAGEWVNSTITLKEAYNMMDVDQSGQGRAVLKDYLTKEQEHYQSWIKFDLTTKDDKGNYPLVKSGYFDLTPQLEKSNIKDIDKPEVLSRIKSSLEKGNETNVREAYKDAETLRGVQVNPRFKKFNFVTPFASSREQEQKNSQAKDMSQDAKNNAAQKESSAQNNGNNNNNNRGQNNRQGKLVSKSKNKGIRA